MLISNKFENYFTSKTSTSKIRVEFGGILPRSRSPYAKFDGMMNFALLPFFINCTPSSQPGIT